MNRQGNELLLTLIPQILIALAVVLTLFLVITMRISPEAYFAELYTEDAAYTTTAMLTRTGSSDIALAFNKDYTLWITDDEVRVASREDKNPGISASYLQRENVLLKDARATGRLITLSFQNGIISLSKNNVETACNGERVQYKTVLVKGQQTIDTMLAIAEGLGASSDVRSTETIRNDNPDLEFEMQRKDKNEILIAYSDEHMRVACLLESHLAQRLGTPLKTREDQRDFYIEIPTNYEEEQLDLVTEAIVQAFKEVR